MKERMDREKRREQLLQIMRTQFAQAIKASDFSVRKIAAEAIVSEVWVYKLIGEEFETLRSKFTFDSPTESETDKLRRENADLRQSNSELHRNIRDLNLKYDAEIKGNYAGAVKLIEAQDEEIRSLQGLKILYEKRLAESGLNISANECLKELSDDSTEDKGVIDDTIDLTEGFSN